MRRICKQLFLSSPDILLAGFNLPPAARYSPVFGEEYHFKQQCDCTRNAYCSLLDNVGSLLGRSSCGSSGQLRSTVSSRSTKHAHTKYIRIRVFKKQNPSGRPPSGTSPAHDSVQPSTHDWSWKSHIRPCFMARNTPHGGSLPRATCPRHSRWILSVRSWAGDTDGGDLIDEIHSGGQVDYVTVDISSTASISCDRILVRAPTSSQFEGTAVPPRVNAILSLLGWVFNGRGEV